MVRDDKADIVPAPYATTLSHPKKISQGSGGVVALIASRHKSLLAADKVITKAAITSAKLATA